MGQHERGDALVDGVLDRLGRHRLENVATSQRVDKTLRHVKIGWEIAVSESTILRFGRIASAAASAWYILIDMVSPITTVPGSAPISGTILSPTRRGWSIQPARFQARINISPHSLSIVCCARCIAPSGRGPRELPSR